MKIIIEVKDTATLDRIEQLSKALEKLYTEINYGDPPYYGGFDDVIQSINKEW